MISLLTLLLGIFLYALPGSVMASTKSCPFEHLSGPVYVIAGSNSTLCPATKLVHPVTNPVAIIGQKGVILIDPGSSDAVGQLVLKRLSDITSKPVSAIINTHIHGLYWLANHAIRQRYPQVHIYAHRKMIERIQNGEGDFWLDAFFGPDAHQRLAYAVPEFALEGGENLTLSGVELKIYHPPNAHTDHDLMIEVVKDRILIMGGLVVEPEVPSQGVPADANFAGQIDAIKSILKLDMKTYVPGQGMPQGIELPRRALRFISAIYRGVQQGYADGLQDFEITQLLKTKLVKFRQWYDFSALGAVVSAMYLQVEQAEF